MCRLLEETATKLGMGRIPRDREIQARCPTCETAFWEALTSPEQVWFDCVICGNRWSVDALGRKNCLKDLW